jgi:predicted unusual protein kinase regulating ubiquinone biosynthesis (AarF/ABC1/UbiB family)
VFVDFGMVGRLTTEARAGLRDMVIALGTRDLDRLVRGYQTIGALLPGTDLERLKEAQRALFDRFWGRSMRELIDLHPREMRQFTSQFRDVIYEMPFQVPADLIFLGRCLGILSGMCTGLDPAFNVFEGIAPFARALLEEEGGDWLDKILKALAESGRTLVSLPGRLDTVLSDLETGRLTVTARADPALDRSLTRLTRAINSLVAAVVFAVLLLVGALLYVNGAEAMAAVAGILALVAGLAILRR